MSKPLRHKTYASYLLTHLTEYTHTRINCHISDTCNWIHTYLNTYTQTHTHTLVATLEYLILLGQFSHPPPAAPSAAAAGFSLGVFSSFLGNSLILHLQRCLLLRRKKKNIFYLFMKWLHGEKEKKALLFSSQVSLRRCWSLPGTTTAIGFSIPLPCWQLTCWINPSVCMYLSHAIVCSSSLHAPWSMIILLLVKLVFKLLVMRAISSHQEALLPEHTLLRDFLEVHATLYLSRTVSEIMKFLVQALVTLCEASVSVMGSFLEGSLILVSTQSPLSMAILSIRFLSLISTQIMPSANVTQSNPSSIFDEWHFCLSCRPRHHMHVPWLHRHISILAHIHCTRAKIKIACLHANNCMSTCIFSLTCMSK